MSGPAVTVRRRLRPGVYELADAHGTLALAAPPDTALLGTLSPGARTALRALGGRDTTEDELAADATDPAERAALLTALDNGWVIRTLHADGHDLCTTVPFAPRRPRDTAPEPGGPLVLSRFARVHRDGDDLLLDSPLADSRIVLRHRDALGVLHAPEQAALSGTALAAVTGELAAEGFLVADGTEEDFTSLQWAPHELDFHTRSRAGRRTRAAGAGFGGTRWAKGRFDPLPERRPPHPGHVLALPAPDLEHTARTDPTLTRVLEERRSHRRHDTAHPLTLDQLGAFLYRTARARRRTGAGPATDRPYPSGGGLYEMEIYVAAGQVEGVPRDFYHYDPHDHALVATGAPPRTVDRLLRDADTATGGAGSPQALLVLAARFGRLMWKYEAMGYALVLKHVGAVQQVMYSVATAMGLAPCALGTGDIDLFARATGCDPVHESSVGEFSLGTLP